MDKIMLINETKLLTSTDEKKRLMLNFFSLSILQAANYVLPLITFPYLVKVLGIEYFGLLAFATATIGYFIILTDYGFNLSATREVSIHRDNKERLLEIFSSVMMIKLILMVVSLIILVILVFSFEKFRKDAFIYFATFGIVIGQTLFPIWFFQGMEKMKYITFLNILAKGLFTIAIFIFIKEQRDYWKVPIFNSLGFILSGIISLWIISKNFNIKFKLPMFKDVKKYFIDSSHFFLSRVSVSIYTSSNTFVLGLFTNNMQVGFYSVAEKLYQALQQIYFPLTQTLYPYMANTKNSRLFVKIFKIVLIGNAAMLVFLFIGTNALFETLFSQQANDESIKVFRILLIAALIVVPSILIGYPFLAAMGYPEYANKSVIYGSLLHIIGLITLIVTNSVNIYFIAILVIITELSVLMYRLYFSKREKLWMIKVEK